MELLKRNGPPGQAGRESTRASGISEQNHTTTPADLLLARLDRVKQTGGDSWRACCPAHDDRNPSLSIKQTDDRLLVHCFSGCESGEVLAAVGLSLGDLFARPLSHYRNPLTRHQRRRHGQAVEAMKALDQELLIVQMAAEDQAAGFNLDDAHRTRLFQAVQRIRTARGIVV